MKAKPSVKLRTLAIPKLGFVRVSVRRAAGRLTVTDAQLTPESLLKVLGR